ncbi:hypothetical protein HME7025_00081 [Aquirufa nivalisilvae]|uniref:Peptidase S74 domain-containing protein n=1 Tax=Aquirufa nivalisilvae TaxID=2516557 RepID=A0A2S2DRF4_9BACT|nr:tail fiber domain-containing protein [Aquirufa nivalisilvae]AWL07966.1 hypothetical protein HME7025_00081 [Aquirufa nivalisilvae]
MTPEEFESGVNNILDSTKPKGIDGSKGITKAIFKQIVAFFKSLLTETINIASSAGYKGLTSVTSITIGTGSKTFTTNKASTSSAFIAGLRVRVINTTTPTNYMEGVITSFTSTTLIVIVDYVAGSGTYAIWEIAVAGQKGLDGSNSVGGTQNFLQKLNSALGFVNSLIYDNGTGVGVNTTSIGSHKFTVEGDTNVNGILYITEWQAFANTVGSILGIGGLVASQFSQIDFYTNGVISYKVKSAGQVEFQNYIDSPYYKMGSWKILDFVSNTLKLGGINPSEWTAVEIHTSGSVRVRITASGVEINSLGTGTVYSNSGILTNTNPSDKKLKKGINPIAYGLNEILQLTPVTYFWKEDKIEQGIQFGFIAQDVKEIMPDLVKEGEGYLGLDKEAIYTVLVKAIQELKADVDSLRSEINR